MDVLSQEEIDAIVARSMLIAKYNETVDRESAYEILTGKLKTVQEETKQVETKTTTAKSKEKEEDKSLLETLGDNTVVKSMMRTAGNQIVRSLLGSLGITGSTRRKKSSWF